MFKVEMSLEVIRYMVGISSWIGGADGTYYFLASLAMHTRHVFLRE